jgi:hypothetical protein
MQEENPVAEPRGSDERVTGDEKVDQAVRPLAKLDDVPVEEHPALLEGVHQDLAGILGELEPDERGTRQA